MSNPPAFVLSQYPNEFARCDWARVNDGGFSGAIIWKGERLDQPCFALKQWPTTISAGQLQRIHSRMTAARTTGCAFVPTIIPQLSEETFITNAAGCWEMTTWMPGQACVETTPNTNRLSAACEGVVALHRSWAIEAIEPGHCPAISRRLRLFAEWDRLRPFNFTSYPAESRTLLEESVRAVESRLMNCRAKLAAWHRVAVPLVTCHCDLWRGNMLFLGDRISGVIDFGAMKIDSPATELGRMLGDWVGLAPDAIADGVSRYQAANPPFPVSADLVQVMAETGAVGSLANWHLRLPIDPIVSYPKVMTRIGTILTRLTTVF
jgi:Ser/Thr protein kinase RdoA (MazF antagonist)